MVVVMRTSYVGILFHYCSLCYSSNFAQLHAVVVSAHIPNKLSKNLKILLMAVCAVQVHLYCFFLLLEVCLGHSLLHCTVDLLSAADHLFYYYCILLV